MGERFTIREGKVVLGGVKPITDSPPPPPLKPQPPPAPKR